MPSQMPLPAVAARPAWREEDAHTRLAEDLRARLEQEQQDWDAAVAGSDMTGQELWESIPTVDSKTVARMAPVFEEHEGRPFDVRRIRRGGYGSIHEAIQHLVYGE